MIEPSVLVLPAFSATEMAVDDPPDELARWLESYDLTPHDIPGVSAPVYAGEGIAVTPTGIGKTAAATTVTALLSSPAVDLTGAHVLSVGVAGIAPDAGPLGSVVLGERVVDWDWKYRWGGTEPSAEGDAGDSPADTPIAPLEFRTRDPVYRLDGDLLDRVEGAVVGAELRATEDERVDGEPGVRRGVSVCGDEFWYGREMAEQVAWLLGEYDLPAPLATQMEDYATAAALARFDRLDRYVPIRAGANYDRPPAGESAARVTDGVGAFDFETATLNAHRAGRRAVEALR